MTRTADVVVVGGGIVGAAAAYEATRLGASTIVVDRRDRGRATDAGAGILSPETTANPDDSWFAFGLAAAEHYRRLAPLVEELTGLPTGYARCGALCLALHEGELPWYRERVELAARRQTSITEVSTADAVALFPPLREMVAAMHNPDAARVDGRLMGTALLQAAELAGAVVLESEVDGFVQDGDKVTEVSTPIGRVGCGVVVIVGGAWSSHFGDLLKADLPITPMKGQIVHLELTDPEATAASGDWPIVQPVANYYLVPWEHGRVVCGGTLEADAGFDTRATALGTYQLLREALRMAPGLRQASLGEIRVGLRPTSPDDAPLLGLLAGHENVFVATGHGTEGLLLGPYSSRCVVHLALDGSASEPLLAEFDPSRFTR